MGHGEFVVGVYIDVRHGEGLQGCEALLVTCDEQGQVRVGNEVQGTFVVDSLIDGSDINIDIIRGIAERLRTLRAA